ncbi:hypothetical protein GALL_509220 [mine drainage metagenome]|uniref:Uncharacterized protein n=1 Tax=mine drainage metagenome TaxID=410659 RepID=A0A1J5PQE0_9ZZZZ
MLEAAQITASIWPTSLPQRAMASRAAATPISARMEISSFGRSGMAGRMTVGSTMPDLFTTWRDLMPEAFSMNSTEEGVSAAISPAAMASACSALKAET